MNDESMAVNLWALQHLLMSDEFKAYLEFISQDLQFDNDSSNILLI